MSEQNPMDRLLSQQKATPVPELSPNFDRRVLKQIKAQQLSRPSIVTLAAYGVFALAVSVWTMNEAGLGWIVIAASVATPVAVVAAVFRRELGYSQ